MPNYKSSKSSTLDSLMRSPKTAALIKEALNAPFGHPTRVRAKKLFQVAGAVSNNYFADGQGGSYDFAGGATPSSGTTRVRLQAPGQDATSSSSSTVEAPESPASANLLFSSPLSAISAKRAELKRKADSMDKWKINYSGEYPTENPVRSVMSGLGQLYSWYHNFDVDVSKFFVKNAPIGGGMKVDGVSVFPGSLNLGTFSPSYRAPVKPTSSVKAKTKEEASGANKGAVAPNAPVDPNTPVDQDGNPIPPPRTWSADELQKVVTQAKSGNLNALQILATLGLTPQDAYAAASYSDPQSMMEDLFNQNMQIASGKSGTSSSSSNPFEALKQSAPGINTFVKEGIPLLDKLFKDMPADQRPYGAADLNQIPVLDATLRKELDLDGQLSRIRQMQSNNQNITGDLKQYIKDKDTNLKTVTDMLDKAKLDVYKLDLSNPYTAKNAEGYLNYLQSLKTRTETRYDDFLKDSSDVYQKQLDSSITMYNDSLTKYQSLFETGAGTIRDNYEAAVGLLTDMYNNGEDAFDKNARRFQSLAMMQQSIQTLFPAIRESTALYDKEYADNLKHYTTVFGLPDFNENYTYKTQSGTEKTMQLFKGSIDSAINAALVQGLTEHGAILHYGNTMKQNLNDAYEDGESIDAIVAYYTPKINEFIASHQGDPSSAEYFSTVAARLQVTLMEGIDKSSRFKASEVQTAIKELIDGGYRKPEEWRAKYEPILGKILADAILDVASSNGKSQSTFELTQLFSQFQDPNSKDGSAYKSFDDVPLETVRDGLIPQLISAYLGQ